MDLAGLVPKYLSMRRGGLLICALGIIIQPWRFLSQAQTFLTVLSSFGGELLHLRVSPQFDKMNCPGNKNIRCV